VPEGQSRGSHPTGAVRAPQVDKPQPIKTVRLAAQVVALLESGGIKLRT
jgi:hypothetical protein